MEEPRMIDANALMDRLEKISETDYGSAFSYEAHDAASELLFDVKRIVKDAPTVPAVVLPCKVGDTVWFVDRIWSLEEKKFVGIVNVGYVKAIKFSARPTKITVEYADMNETGGRCKGVDYFAISIGKTLFLSSEAIEAALAERRAEG